MKHPVLTMHPVKKSSAVAAIGYDPAKKELHVKFKSGDTYRYGGVSEQQHVAFAIADSKGKFLQEHIRPHHVGEKIVSREKRK